MEFAARIQALVRNVAGAFEKPKGERSKCPRCKGSGLLNQRPPWDWQQKVISNDPCWFCEGIGVMPIVGVNGFMLARTSSAFQTRDIKSHGRLPIKVQLYLGKYPGTRCKLSSYKPCEDPADLLHHVGGVPDWLSGEHLQPSESAGSQNVPRSGKSAVLAREGAGKSPRIGLTTPLSTKNRFGSSTKYRSKGNGKFRSDGNSVPPFSRQLGTPSTRISSPRSAPGSAQTSSALPIPFIKGRKELQSGSCRPKLVRSPSKATMNTSEADGHNLNPTGMKRRETRGPNSVGFGTPLLRSPRSFRSPRRERNRIREKAEREAIERARRVQAPSSVNVGQLSSGPRNLRSEGKWPVGNIPESSNWFGVHANKLPFFPWLEPSKGPSSSDYSWVNQMVYGSIKERSHSPRSVKAF